MTLWEALALGVLQGVTEFLPISSSGHLALAQALLGLEPGRTLLFNVLVHFGTLCAIVYVMRVRILRLARSSLGFFSRRADGLDVERRWIGLIVLANVPTAIVGLSLRGFVEEMNQRPVWVCLAFLGTALLLLSAERIGNRMRGPETLAPMDALLMGCAQSVGILPGISRSGATVSLGLWRGLQAETAVELSILISLPAIAGASLLELLREGAGDGGGWAPLAVGMIASFATGIAALQALRWVVRTRRLLPFAAYCALLGTGALFLG